MKKATERVVILGSAVIFAVAIATLLTGCKSAGANDSMSIEFPTVERWWK